MQFINNYHVLHGRTAYEDDRAAGRVRHLKRLWLETVRAREPAALLRATATATGRRGARRSRLRVN